MSVPLPASWRRVQWWLLLPALALSAIGVAFVASATAEPGGSGWIGKGRMQALWLLLGLGLMLLLVQVRCTTWRRLAVLAWISALVVQVLMMALRGTALVPLHKGQANWIDLGPLQLQPSEFIKVAVLLATARLLSDHEVDVRKPSWLLTVLVVGFLPALLLAKEDLGSALTFGPLVLGLAFLAGLRWRHLLLMAATGATIIALGVARLPRDSYHWRRIMAWLDPEAYAAKEGYQTLQGLRALGSGQFAGKGYGQGDQNQLDMLPEKHTDMIFGVIGEETGFVGASVVILLFLAFGLGCLAAAGCCPGRFPRLILGGLACLVLGQAAINLAVITQLMPVTGVTLPFISYGGSSLLGTWCGLGLALACSRERELPHGLEVAAVTASDRFRQGS